MFFLVELFGRLRVFRTPYCQGLKMKFSNVHRFKKSLKSFRHQSDVSQYKFQQQLHFSSLTKTASSSKLKNMRLNETTTMTNTINCKLRTPSSDLPNNTSCLSPLPEEIILKPSQYLPFCHPFGISPPSLHDLYLDGPPPVCGLEKFKWAWEGELWTYRFTVIENRKRMDLMSKNSSHSIAFIPSISPTSSREELRQCARMMANKGHQCLLIEYPGFHTDPHINNRIQQTFYVDDDGIYHLKENLTMGINEIELPEKPLREDKQVTSLLKLAWMFSLKRIKQWTRTRIGLKSKQIKSGAVFGENPSSEGVRTQSTETGITSSTTVSGNVSAPSDNKGIPCHKAHEDSVPYNHIYRSFLRQYIRFLVLQWGAKPLSIVAMGQSSGFLLQALDDLIELGRGRQQIETLAQQLTLEEWRYTGDGPPILGSKYAGPIIQTNESQTDISSYLRKSDANLSNTEQQAKLSNQTYSSQEVRNHTANAEKKKFILDHNENNILKSEACEIVRDAVVADLIRMHLDTVIFGSPYWKSSGRTYFEEMASTEEFNVPIRQYLMGRLCNFWMAMSPLSDYWKQRRFRVETFFSYLVPRFERPISEYNLYKHKQATMRGYPISLLASWLSGWLEPVKSDFEYEALFKKMCVDSFGIRHLPTKTVPPPESRDESYRIPSTLLMIGRSCVDKDFDEINLLAKHCIRLDRIWRLNREKKSRIKEEACEEEKNKDEALTENTIKDTSKKNDYNQLHTKGEVTIYNIINAQENNRIKSPHMNKELKKLEGWLSSKQKTRVDYHAVNAISMEKELSRFNGVKLPRTYGETDDWNYHIDYDKHVYVKSNWFWAYKLYDIFLRPFFPDPKPTRKLMLAKLSEGKDPVVNEFNATNETPNSTSRIIERPLIPRCLPVKGALQCIEEFPRFSAECIDQFIHSRHINFDEIEENWIKNPLTVKDNASEEDDNITETQVC